jgi:SAM-dependent methyltransferase
MLSELTFERPALEFDALLQACPLCGAEELEEFLVDGVGIRVARCGGCALRFMNPQYTDESLERFYADYRIDDKRPLGDFDPERRGRKTRNLSRITRWQPSGRFLGVGCGDGLELVLARELGFDVTGVEIDAARAEEIAERLGLEMVAGDLREADLAVGTWSVIFMDQVLEHLKQPAAYLRRAWELLEPVGVLYIGVPNIRSISSELKSFKDRIGLRAKARRGSHYDTWQHVSYFAPRQLASALEAHFGFEVLDVAGDPDFGGSSLMEALRVHFPVLDSSMLVIARKPA